VKIRVVKIYMQLPKQYFCTPFPLKASWIMALCAMIILCLMESILTQYVFRILKIKISCSKQTITYQPCLIHLYHMHLSDWKCISYRTNTWVTSSYVPPSASPDAISRPLLCCHIIAPKASFGKFTAEAYNSLSDSSNDTESRVQRHNNRFYQP
jgi:hypothetical protein